MYPPVRKIHNPYCHNPEKSAHFLAHPKTFLHAHILGGILSQNFIASTAPIHFPFSVLFRQNHLPTHSSGCTLLVLTVFFLSRESRINVRVRLLILGLFSSGYVLIKGGMFINFLNFFKIFSFTFFFFWLCVRK